MNILEKLADEFSEVKSHKDGSFTVTRLDSMRCGFETMIFEQLDRVVKNYETVKYVKPYRTKFGNRETLRFKVMPIKPVKVFEAPYNAGYAVMFRNELGVTDPYEGVIIDNNSNGGFVGAYFVRLLSGGRVVMCLHGAYADTVFVFNSRADWNQYKVEKGL